MRLNETLTLGIIALAILSACGGGKTVYEEEGVTIAANESAGEMTVKDEASGSESVIKTGEIPEGFPQELVYPNIVSHDGGASVTQAEGTEKYMMLASLTRDTPDKVAQHYKGLLLQRGYHISAEMSQAGTHMIMAEKGTTVVTVSAATEEGEDAEALTSIGVNITEGSAR